MKAAFPIASIHPWRFPKRIERKLFGEAGPIGATAFLVQFALLKTVSSLLAPLRLGGSNILPSSALPDRRISTVRLFRDWPTFWSGRTLSVNEVWRPLKKVLNVSFNLFAKRFRIASTLARKRLDAFLAALCMLVFSANHSSGL